MGAVEVGQTVRRARLERQLSYRDLRDASGLALGHLQRIERGQHVPSPATLRHLGRALGIPHGVLMREAGHL